MSILATVADQSLAKRVARTYGGDRDPWTRVEEYERVQQAMAEHPQKGSGAIASIVNLPRGRIRAWVEKGGAPDPVRGIKTAADRGWLTTDAQDPIFRGLNVLVAWIYSGGSVDAEGVQPRFVVDDRADRERLAAAIDRVGVGVQWKHADDEGRATEAEPDTDQSVLGRVLVALGAPRGEKRNVATLPWYLDTMPRSVRLDWARTYVCNRAVDRPDRPNIGCHIKEERPGAYLQALGRLFQTVATGDDYGVRVGGKIIYLDPSVERQLRQPPTFDGEGEADAVA